MTALRLLALHRLTLEDPYLGLQLVGTVAFAVSGAAVAVRAGMDWLGVAVLAVVTAVGGGTPRDLLLGRLPVGWIQDPWPVWVGLRPAPAGRLEGRRRRTGPGLRHVRPGRGAARDDHRRRRRGGPRRPGPAAAA